MKSQMERKVGVTELHELSSQLNNTILKYIYNLMFQKKFITTLITLRQDYLSMLSDYVNYVN